MKNSVSIDKYFTTVWSKNKGFIKVLLLVVVVIIVLKSGSKIVKSFNKKYNEIFGSPDAPARETNIDLSNIPTGWNSDVIVDEFYQALAPNDLVSWNGSTKCNLAKQIFELNDDQFKTVVLDFESKYATENYPTMKAHMQKEWDTCSVFSTDYFEKVYQKMARLGL